MKKAILLAALVLPVNAQALEVNVKCLWDTPTTKEDGTQLLASEIAQYELEWFNFATLKRGVKTAKPNTNGYVLILPVEGRYGFRIRTHPTYSIGNQLPIWSTQVVKDVKATTPVCTCP